MVACEGRQSAPRHPHQQRIMILGALRPRDHYTREELPAFVVVVSPINLVMATRVQVYADNRLKAYVETKVSVRLLYAQKKAKHIGLT